MSAESSNLSNIEHRAVIKYFVKKGKRPKKFLKTWYQFFRNLRLRIRWSKNGLAYFNKDESCEDDPRPGRPVTIAEELQISKERVGEIIHEHMNMRKISARWVPKVLTPFDKQRRLQTSKDFLELVGDNTDEICDRIVTVDETWVRQYDPESKQESMQWTKKVERPPKKFKEQDRKKNGPMERGVHYRYSHSFTGRNTTTLTVTSRLYSARMWYLTSPAGSFSYCSQVDHVSPPLQYLHLQC
ncbi:Histone-lysine N-methyltransferase SETMAR [Eumeta japonica]|uniref:Histone-lysine N-methyltransferase SETMAR n=1 Tax=Eumeta variegata TaxID=151549 RepID=A0A4C1TUL8_EUMVA|nr:Histone-lysine N-methyltransferase SETMAR [Eumeta japonica]